MAADGRSRSALKPEAQKEDPIVMCGWATMITTRYSTPGSSKADKARPSKRVKTG